MGAEVPRLLLLGGSGEGSATEGGAESHREDEGAGAGADAADDGAVARRGRGETGEIPAGLEGVLPAGADATGLPRAGRVDSSPAASATAQAVEARDDGVPGVAQDRRAGGRRCPSRCEHQTMVAQLGHAPELRPQRGLLRPPRPASAGVTSTDRTAGCGPACPVVWQGSGATRPRPLCRWSSSRRTGWVESA